MFDDLDDQVNAGLMRSLCMFWIPFLLPHKIMIILKVDIAMSHQRGLDLTRVSIRTNKNISSGWDCELPFP